MSCGERVDNTPTCRYCVSAITVALLIVRLRCHPGDHEKAGLGQLRLGEILYMWQADVDDGKKTGTDG
jgi:hypothetical protein